MFDNPASKAKWIEATDGTGRNYKAAKKMGVKIAFGTDMLFDPCSRQSSYAGYRLVAGTLNRPVTDGPSNSALQSP